MIKFLGLLALVTALLCSAMAEPPVNRDIGVLSSNTLRAPYTLVCDVSQADLRSAKIKALDRKLAVEGFKRSLPRGDVDANVSAYDKSQARTPSLSRFTQTYSELNGHFYWDERPVGSDGDVYTGARPDDQRLIYDGTFTAWIVGGHTIQLYKGLSSSGVNRLFLPGAGLGMFPLVKPIASTDVDFWKRVLQSLPQDYGFAMLMNGPGGGMGSREGGSLYQYLPGSYRLSTTRQGSHIESLVLPAPSIPEYLWSFSNFKKVGSCSLSWNTVLLSNYVDDKTGPTTSPEYLKTFLIRSVEPHGLGAQAYEIKRYLHRWDTITYYDSEAHKTFPFLYNPDLSLEDQIDHVTGALNAAGSTSFTSAFVIAGILATGVFATFKRSLR